MKTAIVAISAALLMITSGGMALAAPPTPPAKDHSQAVEQTQTHEQAQNQNREQERDQAQEKGQGKAQGDGKAQGQGKPEGKQAPGFDKRHGAAGVVQGKNADGKSFDLSTNQGIVHVRVNDNTRFSVKGKKDATFADISNGDHVNVNGSRDDSNNLIAKLVHKIPGQGEGAFGHALGLVKDFKAPNGSNPGSITITDRKTGKDSTFSVTSSTKMELPNGKTAPGKGDLVTVVGTKDGTNTARGIVVHEPDDKDKKS